MTKPTPVEIPAPYYDSMLGWCNERRAEDGKKPLKKLPDGIPGDPTSCPCGEASGWKISTESGYRYGAVMDSLHLPILMQRGIQLIDEHPGGTLVRPVRKDSTP